MSARRYIFGVQARDVDKVADAFIDAFNALDKPRMQVMAEKYGPEFVNAPVFNEDDKDDAMRYTVLQFAVRDDDDRMVDFLITMLDANPHIVLGDTGMDALTLAAKHNKSKALSELLNTIGVHPFVHPTVRVSDKFGTLLPVYTHDCAALYTALENMASGDKCVKLILKACDNISSDGCWLEKDGVYAQVFIVSPHAPISRRPSLIHALAFRNQSLSTAHVLARDKYFNPNQGWDNIHGNTTLHFAFRNFDFLICEVLLCRGANPRMPNASNLTPLDVLDLPSSHWMAPSKLTASDVRQLKRRIATIDALFEKCIAPIHKWSYISTQREPPPPMSREDLELYKTATKARGPPFYGWHGLPREIVHKIMHSVVTMVFPDFHWLAMFDYLRCPRPPRVVRPKKRNFKAIKASRGHFQEPL